MPLVRYGRQGGRGGERGRVLNREAAEQALLRPVLEAAVLVARAGELADPVEPAPTPLRPFLAFAKFPPRAMVVARRVLDDDPAFRARVLAGMRPEAVGDAGRLFLERPGGWTEAYEAHVDRALAARTTQTEARTEQRATKQLELTKGTLSKIIEELDEAKAELGRSQARVVELAHEVAGLRAEADRLRHERAAAVRDLKAVEARDAGRLEEIRLLREQLGAAMDGASDGGLVARAEVDAAVGLAVAAARAEAELAAADLGRRTADALAAVAADVERAATFLHRFAAHGIDGVAPVDAGVSADGDAGADPAARVRRVRGTARRQPTKLPLGLFDDSPDAVGPLLRTEGMQVLVDGYNLSLTGWPNLDLDLQRSRLLDVLGGLEATVPAAFLVVFDGSTTGVGLPPESRLRSVQVRFTQPGVEADDAILALVDTTHVTTPVTVVSSDHRVRDGARARGANVVGSNQLLAYLRS